MATVNESLAVLFGGILFLLILWVANFFYAYILVAWYFARHLYTTWKGTARET